MLDAETAEPISNIEAAEPTLDIDAAIAVLVEHGVINTPEYWLTNYDKLKYLDWLIVKMANRLRELAK